MQKPKLSIVICTFNREKYIPEALESIRSQLTSNEDYELIAVDNNSTDRSPELIKTFIAENPGRPYYYVHEGKQGLSYARNAGIEHAKAELITFIDDDAIARPDFVQNTIAFFEKHKDAAAMGGRVIPKFTVEEPEWFSSFVRKSVSEINFGPKVKVLEGRKYPFGANMSFRADVFRQYGLFNTDLGRKGNNLLSGEEKDIFDRLKQNGGKIYYDPEVVVQHIIEPHRLTKEYIQRLSIGVGISEQIRLKNKGAGPRLMKWLENKAKRAGSILIGSIYELRGEKAKGQMIKDVMRWIEEGYSKKL
jgi:glycosyltransferase involved in cell wall biosynthesis